MSEFEPAVAFVLNNEGGVCQNEKDPGGTTNFGISLRLLKSLSPETLKKYSIHDQEVSESTILNLTVEQAKLIYYGEFWDYASFDKIERQEDCNYIFDMAVNMGIAPAIKCVQRACWAIMGRWEILPDDGRLGVKTLAAIRQCGLFFKYPLRAERGSYYRAIIEKNPNEKEFLRGWYGRTYNT